MIDLSKITITPEILSLISEIDEFKGSWRLYGRMASERLKTLGLAAKIESIGASTRLDGLRLADTDLYIRVEKDYTIYGDEYDSIYYHIIVLISDG
jgi:hypothetical protein